MFMNHHRSIFNPVAHHGASAMRDVDAKLWSFDEKQSLNLNLDIILWTTEDGRLLPSSILRGSVLILGSVLFLFLHLSQLAFLSGSSSLLLLLGRGLGLGSLWRLWGPGGSGLLLRSLFWRWGLLAVGDGFIDGGLDGLLLLVVFFGLLDDALVAFGTVMVLVGRSRSSSSAIFENTNAAALLTISHSVATFSKSIYSLLVKVGNPGCLSSPCRPPCK